jgi:polyribonucleotide nucleotidyltransferase
VSFFCIMVFCANMQSKTFSLDWAGKTLTAEFTDLTVHANGSVLLKLGETAILVTAVMSEHESKMDYFPLSVEFEEKFYAAGQILGSRFMRREGRPSDEAVLSARIIDRTIRPLFDQSTRQDIQVVVSVLALGDDDPDVLGIIGASLALGVSNIPWRGPVGAVRIGRRKSDGEILINPGYLDRADNALDFEILACGKDATINMIEVGANEVSEPNIMAVLGAASSLHAQIEQWQHNIINEIGTSKKELFSSVHSAEIANLYNAHFKQKLFDTVFSERAGKAHIYECKKEFLAFAKEAELDIATAGSFFEEQIDETLHEGALIHNKRADGRNFDTVRPLYAKAGGISPVIHGSGIFYRGDTHIFSALTLGGPQAAQLLDTIEDQDVKKRFMHHYNCPPYSVGETGRVGGFNRRMIGHGALAEKALAPMIPNQTDFPYTIRLVSETLTSNGSSSMGSVCASTIALLDGGVPLKRPVAGIASGVMINGDDYKVMTDIQGPEDEFGDMDFKVAGTTEGITAIQMDVKVDGVPIHILAEALEKARVARLHILETMKVEIAAPRPTISPRAPQIISLQILPEQIGLVIGGGGKTIKKIEEDTGVEEISVEDDGSIFITGTGESANRAADIIRTLTKTYTVGERLDVTIVKTTNFGAFAKLDDQHEGLIHISEIAPFRISKVADVLQEGEVVSVVINKVEDGKIGLSIKDVTPEFAQSKGINPPE